MDQLKMQDLGLSDGDQKTIEIGSAELDIQKSVCNACLCAVFKIRPQVLHLF